MHVLKSTYFKKSALCRFFFVIIRCRNENLISAWERKFNTRFLSVDLKTHIHLVEDLDLLQKIRVKWVDEKIMFQRIIVKRNPTRRNLEERRNQSFGPSRTKLLGGTRMGSIFPILRKLGSVQCWNWVGNIEDDQFPSTLSHDSSFDAEQLKKIQRTHATSIDQRRPKLIPATWCQSIS